MRKSHNILFVTLFIVSLSASAFAADVQTPAAAAGVVNLNTADVAQLSMLPRVGAKAAQRIIDYRTANGPFRKTTDLMQVKGFGDKTYERLSSYISIDGKTTLSAKVQSPRKPRKQPTTTASK
ncbi:MAG: helix-hairpin-helix domain-containing protein [Thermoanaerobaculia bacterium]|nr:helix-hairpin-helix domain-containing protein [Thermoanaerobaculia bacterium]